MELNEELEVEGWSPSFQQKQLGGCILEVYEIRQNTHRLFLLQF